MVFLATVGLIAFLAATAVAGGVVIRRSDDKVTQAIGFGLAGVYGTIALIYAVLGVVTLPSGDVPEPALHTCSQFPSQNAAQIFYDELREQGSPGWEGLAVDERGVVCEGSTFLKTRLYKLQVGDTIYVYENPSDTE